MDEQEILKKYTPLVKGIASKYASYGVPLDDLIQEGMIGLWRAIEKFDSTKETKFSTYATYWIKKYILQSLETETKTSLNALELKEDINHTDVTSNTEPGEAREESLGLPDDLPEIERKVLALLYGLDGKGSRDLTTIAEITNLPREKVRQIKEKGLRRLKKLKKENID